MINIVILVIDRNYDVNDARTANIHLMVLAIDQIYDINGVVRAKSCKITRITSYFQSFT